MATIEQVIEQIDDATEHLADARHALTHRSCYSDGDGYEYWRPTADHALAQAMRALTMAMGTASSLL